MADQIEEGRTPVMGTRELPDDFDLVQHAMDQARKAAEKLTEPDEDAMPLLLWVGPYGLGIMPLVDMHNEAAKDELALMMTTILAVSRATQAVQVTTSWAVIGNGESSTEELLTVMPSKHPDRKECITLMYMTTTAGEDRMVTADITRHKHAPPDLGEWDSVGSAATERIGGRFGDAVHMGLDFAAEMPAEMVQIIDDGWRDNEQEQLMQRFHGVFQNFVAAIEAEREADKT